MPREAKKKEKELLKRSARICNNLYAIGKEYGIASLLAVGHPSSYVQNMQIKPKYQARSSVRSFMEDSTRRPRRSKVLT